MPVHKGIKVAAQNRKARHDYFIEDTYECGIALQGTEVKSIRNGALNLKDSYAQVKNGELFLIGMHISPYEQGNIYNHDPFRTRKLLAHAREIRKLNTLSQADGYSLVPLSVYFKDGKVKVVRGQEASGLIFRGLRSSALRRASACCPLRFAIVSASKSSSNCIRPKV